MGGFLKKKTVKLLPNEHQMSHNVKSEKDENICQKNPNRGKNSRVSEKVREISKSLGRDLVSGEMC